MYNFYLGSDEYFIKFDRGQHVIINASDYVRYDDDRSFVFRGTFAECIEESAKMICEYRECEL